MRDIQVWHHVTLQQFNDEIRPAGEPVVFRRLVSDWPIVVAARRGDKVLADVLRGQAADIPLQVAVAPPEAEGRLHYTDDVHALNFERVGMAFPQFLERLFAEAGQETPFGLAAQGMNAQHGLPGFASAHILPILPPSVPPRLWIGNAVKVATHNDELENIACVAAGRRRFTLFPPEQVGNLYLGPFELTPGGTPISMVHVTKPDFERYPRFAEALEAALVAELEPGDALYIPYQWYHHVESLAPVNILVNYWWNDARDDLGYAWDALLHGVVALRGMPADQRRAWRAAFDHYIFLTGDDPGAHLPADVRGVLGADSPEDLAQFRADLIKNLTSTTGERFGPMK